MKCITFRAPWFFSNFLHCNIEECHSALGHQFWMIRVHPWVIHCQNGRKEYSTFPPPLVEMCSGSTAHVWHAGLHSACVKSTL
jgi:hypothetical protein